MSKNLSSAAFVIGALRVNKSKIKYVHFKLHGTCNMLCYSTTVTHSTMFVIGLCQYLILKAFLIMV